MRAVNVQTAKTHLSRSVDEVQKAKWWFCAATISLSREIRRIEPADEGTPEFGIFEGFGVSPEFLEPLPEDLLRASERS